jgi:hypothetical protein
LRCGTAAEPVPEADVAVVVPAEEGTVEMVAARTATRAASTTRRNRCRGMEDCAKTDPL